MSFEDFNETSVVGAKFVGILLFTILCSPILLLMLLAYPIGLLVNKLGIEI